MQSMQSMGMPMLPRMEPPVIRPVDNSSIGQHKLLKQLEKPSVLPLLAEASVPEPPTAAKPRLAIEDAPQEQKKMGKSEPEATGIQEVERKPSSRLKANVCVKP